MTEGLNKKHEKKCMNRKLKGVNRTETQEKVMNKRRKNHMRRKERTSQKTNEMMKKKKKDNGSEK